MLLHWRDLEWWVEHPSRFWNHNWRVLLWFLLMNSNPLIFDMVSRCANICLILKIPNANCAVDGGYRLIQHLFGRGKILDIASLFNWIEIGRLLKLTRSLSLINYTSLSFSTINAYDVQRGLSLIIRFWKVKFTFPQVLNTHLELIKSKVVLLLAARVSNVIDASF